ncbi:MAG: hypothetical protein WDN28_10585 [Chthoniobacter sp.]
MALALKELVVAMAGPKLPIAVAAGAGDDHTDLGTNGMEIMEAITAVMSNEGVVVLMDMGSALLSTETALGFLEMNNGRGSAVSPRRLWKARSRRGSSPPWAARSRK